MAITEDTTHLANAFHDYVTKQYGTDRVTRSDMIEFLDQSRFPTGYGTSTISSVTDDGG